MLLIVVCTGKNMNWIGGARNRIKLQGERKIQQEFFERQNFASARSLSARTPVQNKRGLSQDLIALHTVSRVHSNFSAGPCKPKSIKRVDLEKFHSCTRQINEVDMGPCSPQTQSKLLLSDGKLDKSSGFPVSIRNVDQAQSQDFLKPDNMLKDKACRQYTEKPGQNEQIIAKFEELSEKSSVENPVDVIALKQQREFSFCEPKPVSSFENSCRKANLGYDPFASEDFQVTPLVRYSKKRSPNNMEVVKHKKRKHSGEPKSWVKEIQDNHKAHSSKHQFTSTPVTEIHRKCDLVADDQNFGGISPIFKATTFSKDVDIDFKFSPHSVLKVPNIKDSDNKGKPTVNKIQGKFQQKSEKEWIKSGTSYKTDGQTVQSFKHLNDKDDSLLHNYEDLRTCSSEEHEINRKLVMSPYFRSSLCSSGPDSESALSKDNTTDDRSESSIGRDSVMLELSLGHAGSLSKYKQIIRKKVIERSPVLDNDSDSFKNSSSEKYNKEIQISKPNFKDIEEEFHYTPMKAKVRLQSEIMNMYRKLGNSPQLQVGSAKGEDLMLDETQRNNRQFIRCSVKEVPSPIPADEFPKHLLSPSDQLQEEIDRKLAQIVTDERKKKTDVQDREDEESARCYKPLKCHMEDVLDEMKKLEEQDTGTPVYCDEKVREDIPQSPQGDVATESFEADAYLETECLLLDGQQDLCNPAYQRTHKQTIHIFHSLFCTQNADVECMEMVEENGNEPTSGIWEKDSIIKDQEYTAKLSDSVKTLSDPDINQLNENKEIQKDLTGETNMDIKIKASGASVAECSVINKPAENEKANPWALIDNDAMNSAENVETGVLHKIEGYLSSCATEKINHYKIEDKPLKANGNIQNKHDLLCLSWNKDFGRNENCDGKSNMFDNIANNAEFDVKTGKLEASGAVVPEQLQVPEISSGKNKLTQTDVSWSLKKSFVDESTSPFQELNYIKLTDTGVQCDLGTFPTLADLAGKSLSFKSVKNAASLHKFTDTIKVPATADASKENMELSNCDASSW